jgi:hypothetical protein
MNAGLFLYWVQFHKCEDGMKESVLESVLMFIS